MTICVTIQFFTFKDSSTNHFSKQFSKIYGSTREANVFSHVCSLDSPLHWDRQEGGLLLLAGRIRWGGNPKNDQQGRTGQGRRSTPPANNPSEGQVGDPYPHKSQVGHPSLPGLGIWTEAVVGMP